MRDNSAYDITNVLCCLRRIARLQSDRDELPNMLRLEILQAHMVYIWPVRIRLEFRL